ncbi:hypothetical protein [Rhodoplanes sp. Z2-YC6860]|uniref:hypothetical protein n=1 Tax=Rhodoplanes sp. Z2-YC6860 TaxID=674703 RepID=UPI00078BB97B|nr:hypothetical protein [Rhodoplanes sp. Z2-YC6860]AMN42263.1 hypothetical protein RHPLAN_38310 [Rhodoplanes sp. Z2-YC6860]
MKFYFALAAVLVAFTPVTASAQSQEDQQACMNDAFTVCGDAIPDRARVAACLARNINRISAPCRMVMARYSKQGPAASRRERGFDQGDRYDRGDDQPDRPDRWDQYDQRGRYGRY